MAVRLGAGFGLAVILCLGIVSAAGANHSVTDLVSIGPAGGSGSFPAQSVGSSQDASHVFFTTGESLVAGDTDASTDIYERFGAATTHVSIGPSGGNGAATATFAAASADGSRVFFTTAEVLAFPDSDNQLDIYERSGGNTTLVSQGTTGGNGTLSVTFNRISADGTRVLFQTLESLVPGDTDSSIDLYERSGGTTTLLSTGPAGGNGAFPVSFGGASLDATRVFFTTNEPLVAGDTDTSQDIYERSGGSTTLVSTGPAGGNGAIAASFAGASPDGTHVFFTTNEPLVAGDTDTSQDIYERSGGTTSLVSTGPAGGNGAFTAFFDAASQDGTRVFIHTSESLVSGDTDSSQDVYERTGGTTTLVSTGPAGGNGAIAASFARISQDGTRVFFVTQESLVAADSDSSADLYERFGGATTLVSTGPTGSNAAFGASLSAISQDGTRVFFVTQESLVAADSDSNAADVYERFGGTTTLVSTGPAEPGGVQGAVFERASLDGTRVIFRIPLSLVAADTDSQTDVYMSSTGVTTGFPRPRGATPLFLALVPVYEPCTSGNTTHGAPFAFLSCNPPTPTSDYLTVGTPDANGKGANSLGSVRLGVLVGNTSTVADEADITVAFSFTDVRRQSDLSDYTGELRGKMTLRITDRRNGGDNTLPGTVADMPFGFTVPCAATVSTTVGGTCTLNTTLDALVLGGAVKESVRSIFKLIGDTEVFDGGADGDGDTAGDNTLFAGSGLFVP